MTRALRLHDISVSRPSSNNVLLSTYRKAVGIMG
jgi:hypothetical protein